MVIHEYTLPRRNPMVIGLCVALWLGAFAMRLAAADPPVPETALVVDPATVPETPPELPAKPNEQERRVKVTAGLAALAGITITGIVLAAVIVIWGGRLRRLVREPLTATGRQDPFWFLRPKKSVPTETTESES